MATINNDVLLRAAAMQQAAKSAASSRVNPAFTGTPAQVSGRTTGEVNTSSYIGNINRLSEKYGVKAPTTEAAAATYTAPVNTLTTEPSNNLTKINDANVAIAARSGQKTAIPSALKFNSQIASSAYAKYNTSSANADTKSFAPLSGVSISETNNNSKASAFPTKSGNDYTLGLNFGGDKNIFNKKFMEIC